MTCCHIVPEDVLRQLAKDTSLPETSRVALADTAAVDVKRRELRSLRAEVPTMTAIPIPFPLPFPFPKKLIPVSVYTCNHTQSLPGVLINNPGNSTDPTAKHVFVETRSLAKFYQTIFKRYSIDNAGMACCPRFTTATNITTLSGTGRR